MRRKDREITDFNDMLAVIDRCDVCRLALNDNDYPYIVPLNFGADARGEQVTLYFHSAMVGTKLELIRRDNRASFEMDCGHELVLENDTGNCTMTYESVIGRGTIEFVPEEEKTAALRILMRHYRSEDFPFNEAVVPKTEVFKLTVSSMTGKRRRMPRGK